MWEETVRNFLDSGNALRTALLEELKLMEHCEFNQLNTLSVEHINLFDQYSKASISLLSLRRFHPLPAEVDNQALSLIKDITATLEKCRHAVDHALGIQKFLCDSLYEHAVETDISNCPYSHEGKAPGQVINLTEYIG